MEPEKHVPQVAKLATNAVNEARKSTSHNKFICPDAQCQH